MQVFVTPYFRLSRAYATTTTPRARTPQANSSVGPFELLGDPLALLGPVVALTQPRGREQPLHPDRAHSDD